MLALMDWDCTERRGEGRRRGPVLHSPTDGLVVRLPFEILYVYPIYAQLSILLRA
jgi:hypothetical protein